MMRGPISQTALLAGALLLLGAGTPYESTLDAGACRPAAPALVAGLGADWQGESGYVQDCRVSGPDGKIALSVAVVRIDRMQADRWFDTHHDPHFPWPVLLDGESHVVGKLAEGSPTDLPGALRVTFKNWRDGMPLRIDLYETFETALPPHALASQAWRPASASITSWPTIHSKAREWPDPKLNASRTPQPELTVAWTAAGKPPYPEVPIQRVVNACGSRLSKAPRIPATRHRGSGSRSLPVSRGACIG